MPIIPIHAFVVDGLGTVNIEQLKVSRQHFKLAFSIPYAQHACIHARRTTRAISVAVSWGHSNR